MKKFLHTFYTIFAKSDLFTKAAALAYYTLFSLPPMLVIIVSVVSQFIDESSVKSTVFQELTRQLGYTNAQEIYEIMNRIGIVDIGLGPSLIGVGILLFIASTIFVSIRYSLNEIFEITPSRSGWKVLVFDRIISASVVILLAFLLLASLIINTTLQGMASYLQKLLPEFWAIYKQFSNFWFPLVSPVFFFAILFRTLPETKVPWKVISIGSAFTAFLFFIGKRMVNWYISNSEFMNVFSATGSVVIILVWIYYTSFIFYFGAVFTATLKKKFQQNK